MKFPRDISGTELAALLTRYGYSVTRQTGSHLRLTTQIGGEHHLTIPAHSSLRVGTLSAILGEAARHQNRDKFDLIRELWG
ncbi:MAG: type II toxin-antitoxin system HicA family toxin [Candidatus Omnitrophota bacterium]